MRKCPISTTVSMLKDIWKLTYMQCQKKIIIKLSNFVYRIRSILRLAFKIPNILAFYKLCLHDMLHIPSVPITPQHLLRKICWPHALHWPSSNHLFLFCASECPAQCLAHSSYTLFHEGCTHQGQGNTLCADEKITKTTSASLRINISQLDMQNRDNTVMLLVTFNCNVKEIMGYFF